MAIEFRPRYNVSYKNRVVNGDDNLHELEKATTMSADQVVVTGAGTSDL